MPQGEVPSTQGRTAVDGQPEDLDFWPAASQRLEKSALKYYSNLQNTARICAGHDDADVVQLKHVKDAEKHVCRMGPDSPNLGDNYHFWWLLSGLCLAAALALPDASQLFFGSPAGNWHWFWVRAIFIVLILSGAVFAVIAYLIALGPHQPKRFLQAKSAIRKLLPNRCQ